MFHSFVSYVWGKMDTTTSSRPPKRRNVISHPNSDLIELVNQLQNKLAATGHSLDVSLPQIVVVGSQSAGKSSVLENVVGREFLPRGAGVVTRRPTVVQLEPYEGEDYAVFLHREGEKFEDFQKVKDEIQNETLRDPGTVGFSSKPISLKIYSPNVLKLTLVDLPGLIRVTMNDQSENCIEEVRHMVMQYIQQPNSLILAVTPANQDLANSDALEVAKAVDPQRIRTIGVLTKLDLMDDGTDAREILENKKIPLLRGYVGVLNRSQKDIEEDRDIQYCLEKEKKFFASMPCYKHMADKMGSRYLQKKLHQQLRAHIKDSLPELRAELSDKLNYFKEEIKDIEEKIGGSVDGCDMKFYLIKLIQEFTENLFIEVLGSSEKVDMNEFSAGVLMNSMLYKLHNDLNLPKVPKREQLLKIIANMHGIRNGISLPDIALDAVNSRMVTQYIGTINRFVENVAEFFFSNIEKIAEKMDSYSNLKSELLHEMKLAVDAASDETKFLLKKHMKAESFVNVHHPDFRFPVLGMENNVHPFKSWDPENNQQSIASTSDCEESDNSINDSMIKETLTPGDHDHSKKTANNSYDHTKRNAIILAKMIKRYLIIQKKQIADTLVKYIVTFLIKEVLNFAKWKLLGIILESPNYDFLLEDCAKDFNKITEIQIACDCLEEAINAVKNF